MNLHVVRVPISASPVVSNEDVGTLFSEDVHDFFRHCGWIRIGKSRASCGSRRLPIEARICVSKVIRPLHTEGLTRLLQFGLPQSCNVVGRGDVTGDQTRRPVGGHDQDHSMPMGRQASHGPGRQQGFIIWMRVDKYDCGHPLSVS